MICFYGRKLALDHNQIASLPLSFNQLQNLRELDISHNQLEELKVTRSHLAFFLVPH